MERRATFEEDREGQHAVGADWVSVQNYDVKHKETSLTPRPKTSQGDPRTKNSQGAPRVKQPHEI